MTYEIGQKVETPLGIGVVKVIDKDLKGNTLVAVNIGKLPIDYIGISFKENDIKPYKTPHEKLLDMGLHLKITKNWAGGVFSHEWWNDNNDRVVVFFVDEKVTTVYEGNNEIMRIIPEYLEWLEEEK